MKQSKEQPEQQREQNSERRQRLVPENKVDAPTPLEALTKALGEENAMIALDCIELCSRRVADLAYPRQVVTPVLAFPEPYGEFGAVKMKINEPLEQPQEESKEHGESTERQSD